MNRRTMWIAGGAAALVVLGTGAGIAAGSGVGDDHDTPITGDALDKASAAALQETGGGKVTGTEIHDEEGYYEVEVTLDNGDQVDVHLDSHFKLVNSSPDHEDRGADDSGGADD